jgi:tRNA (cytidine/uridine-2'-O-)-methyltransferase
MNAELHIVLYQPEIPPNTGNIARLCACTGIRLHLVHPLGFAIDDRQLKRAGLDYWPYLKVCEYAGWKELREQLRGMNWYGLTTKATQTIWQTHFLPGDVLVMGPETRGLPRPVLDEITPLCIPMRQDAPVRSLNLSSACAVAAFEALRQIDTSRPE